MKTRRQAAILELISEYPIETQEELLVRLHSEGYNVTQATVSRDIKELRLFKTLDGEGRYRYTALKKSSAEINSSFRSFFDNSVISVKQAQSIVVVKTLSGMAQAVCATIDRLELKGVAGTIAGEDTIFIACMDFDRACEVTVELKNYL